MKKFNVVKPPAFWQGGKRTVRLMKISALLLFAGCLSISAAVNAQKNTVDLRVKDCSIINVLEQIQEQTGYRFAYSDQLSKSNQKVTLDVSNKNISEVLDVILEDMDYKYRITDDVIILLYDAVKVSENITAQQAITVSGRVIDAQGEPLPGVNVFEKSNPQNGVITGVNGGYTISIENANAIIVFSFIGFDDQEINVAGRTEVNVTLVEEVTDLDEVVIVAYGAQKKSHLTAAVDQISGKVLENRPLKSVASGLQGTIAGLNVRAPSGAPEAGLNLNVRGFTGFGVNGSPLVLVDGVERNINDINPSDVASVSVLKDGAASAIYGSRAPFGVVLLTTKKGSKGDRMKVRYSANFRNGKPWGIPKHQNSADFARSINNAYYNNPGGNGSAFYEDLQIQRMEAFAAGDYDNEVFDGINPEYVPYGTYPESANNWGGHKYAFGNTNWLDLALRDVVPSQEHNISVSGGGKNTSYYIGLGYNENKGIFTGPNFKNRYTVLTKLDTDINKWLSLNISANYVKTDEEGPNFWGQGRDYGAIFNTFARAFPNWVTTNPNGSSYRFNVLPNLNGEAGTDTRYRNDLTLTGGFKIEPIKNLEVNGDFTWRNNNNEFDRTTLQIMQVLPNGKEVKTQRTANNSAIMKNFSRTNYHTIDIHASYSKTIAEKHNLFGLIGFQQEENEYSNLRGDAQSFYSNSIQTISTSSKEFKSNDELYHWATRGYFGRLSYNYDTKYFVEFNIRHDATSRFLENDRWGTFPSISGAWNVARENFWILKDWVTMFKLRGSWSSSGNAEVDVNHNNRVDKEDYYPFYPTIGTGISEWNILGGEFVTYATMPGLVSNQLTWAKPTTIDVGVDVSAFKNRLEFSYDWYQRTVHDQFGPAKPLPETLGTTVPPTNNATSETRGWEFKISWRDKAFNILGKPLNYNVNFSMSDYIGYVVDYEDNGTGAIKGQWTKGEVFGQNYHYISNGIATGVDQLYGNVPQGGTWYYAGDVMRNDLNGDGEINGGTTGTWYSRGDLIKNGFNYPRKSYGIMLGANWNNFDVSMQLDGVGHWKVYSTNKYVWGNQGSQWHAPYYQQHNELGYWTMDNQDAFLPRNTYNSKNRESYTDQYTLDLSHLRIRNLTLGYNIPESLINKIGMSKLYVYGSVENLGFVYYNSFIKYDPELLDASSGEGYPPQQYFSFGVNVEF